MTAAAVSTALTVGVLVRALIPPPRRLRSRVRPYLVPQMVQLRAVPGEGVFQTIFGPMVRDLAERLGSTVDRFGNETSLLRLRQAGWYRGLDEGEMVARYRLDQLKSVVMAGGVGLVSAGMLRVRLPVAVTLVALAVLFGITRTQGRLQHAIERRRDLMRIEIYTVNQLLAMRVRAGGGVIHAVKTVTRRGVGEVVGELNEALRLHRAGWSGPDAFRRIAEVSPEPFCTRTYRLLASAEERGADLAAALLALSEDVRETRREALKRTATKRRAAMLIPTIAILAPVLILFVAAPLPYLITSWQ
ncbi:MAG: type II secretion system F family protein [Actinobacteria bacterium]|nr:type II secretion system F family protein [Actinomycetota bacterium]